MANPQRENGYTPIANEILEEVAKRKFGDAQLRVLLVVWRYTYGFQRKSHALPVSLIAEVTGMKKDNVKRVVQRLIEKKVLIVAKEATFNSPRELAFNKNYDEWEVPRENENTQGKPEVPGDMDITTPGDMDIPSPGDMDIPSYKEKEKKEKNTTTTDIKGEASDDPFAFYEQNFGVITPLMAEELSLWLDDGSFDEPAKVIILAMKEALYNNVRKWSYVNNILCDWRDKRLRTVRDVNAYQLEWKRRQKQQQQRAGPAVQQDGPIYRRA